MSPIASEEEGAVSTAEPTDEAFIGAYRRGSEFHGGLLAPAFTILLDGASSIREEGRFWHPRP